jgi:hypothetical protein
LVPAMAEHDKKQEIAVAAISILFINQAGKELTTFGWRLHFR